MPWIEFLTYWLQFVIAGFGLAIIVTFVKSALADKEKK